MREKVRSRNEELGMVEGENSRLRNATACQGWTMEGNMSYRNKRFNKQFSSLDKMLEKYSDTSKASATSDGGLGVERMMEAIEEGEKIGQENRCTADDSGLISREWDTRVHESDRAEREEALFEAEMRLVEAGKGYLIRVLLLIVENGADRDKSMTKVPRRTYFRHRDELMKFFHCPPPPHL